ncbi:hypothetical protein Tco_1085148, partial [Tanacetum coccineum]
SGRHLAIGSWTHPERLVFRVVGVTWPLALGLIRNVLRSGRHLAISFWTHPKRLAFRAMASLGHWLLDSSRTSYVPGNGRHLAIGSWTHPECLVFWVMGVTWPLALGLIRNVLRSG